jgi:photosystem II stability/assembly factor-like uncharacterized protein
MSGNAVSSIALLPSLAAAPNGKSIWRFGARGEIAHSTDGGKTWQSQSAGVRVTLTSGSAPAKNICWIAGASGTLLRTTDHGKHWQIVITPIAADLAGVTATDKNHAAIWTAGNQSRFATADGGLTWKQVAMK